jgi:hypothetical protein
MNCRQAHFPTRRQELKQVHRLAIFENRKLCQQSGSFAVGEGQRAPHRGVIWVSRVRFYFQHSEPA